jgi:exoribonuclease R
MQYYKDYTINLSKDLSVNKELFSGTIVKENTINLSEIIEDKDTIKSGFLNKIDEDYFVDNIKITNNRGIYGDEVYIDIINNEVVGIKNRNLNYIVGILDITSKIRYGFSNHKLFYVFRPTDKRINNFYIPYEIKNDKIKKLYVIIQFKEWKTIDKLPIGNLIEVIGNVGDIESEYEHLRYFYNIKNNTYKIDNDKRINDIKIIEDIQSKSYDYKVFSIDPIGSTDIDDAFHFIDIDDNYYEFGIHIASPFIFFGEDIEKVLDRVSTVYLPNKKYNMLPNIYADNLLSLLENKNRFAISIILKINKISNSIDNIKIKESIVNNIKNYDYDSFDILYKNKKIKKNIIDCMKYSAYFFHKDLDTFDSHQLVELWMIKANKIIAKYLIDLKLNNMIVRTNKQSEDKEHSNIYIDNKLLDYLLITKQNSALYEIYNYDNALNNESQTHFKLGDEYYTHFTSPIRRSIDLFIHGLLIRKNDLLENKKLQNYIEKINIFNKNNRRFDRNIKRLELLNNIKISGQSGNIITYGYIVKISNYKIKIYIPEYNLEENIIIIPYKFKDISIYTIEKDDNSIINSIEYVIDLKENINKNPIKYTLYQRLNIKLWIFMSFDNIFDKLKIEIIDL